MKVLITAASYSSHISGVQRHAFNMVRCLLLRPEISMVYLVLAPWQREMVEASGLVLDRRLTILYAEMGRDPVARNLWYYRQLPKLASQLRPDLVHLSYPMPINKAAIGCPTVLTLHDLYPYEIPSNFGKHRSLFNRIILWHCMRNVDAIACVSDATMARLVQYTSREIHRKATRIYNCVEPEPRCAAQSPLPGWNGEPFLLSIAQHRRNKNIPLLIRSFNRLLRQERIHSSSRLVVVGVQGPETQHINEVVTSCGLETRVFFLEGLSQPQLQWCYMHSEVVVLPSETEGFGLPVAEALLAGCRVVCSDIPAFREIGSEHCEFVSLLGNAESGLATGIISALQKPAQQSVLLPHLAAQVLAEQYAKLYRDLVPPVATAKGAMCIASI